MPQRPDAAVMVEKGNGRTEASEMLTCRLHRQCSHISASKSLQHCSRPCDSSSRGPWWEPWYVMTKRPDWYAAQYPGYWLSAAGPRGLWLKTLDSRWAAAPLVAARN